MSPVKSCDLSDESPVSSQRKMKSNRSQIKNVRSFTRPKSAKRGIHVKGSWKAVELDPSLFSEEGMGGLVCFEELTDYRLIDSAKEETKAKDKAEKDKKKREERKEKKKAKKRKASEGDKDGGKQEEVCEGGSDKNETSEKAAKKKRKNNKKKTAQQNDPTTQDDISADSEVKSEEVSNEVQNLGNGSEKVVKEEEKVVVKEEEAPEETVSQNAVMCPEDAQPQSNNTKTDGKKRKKKREVEKQKVPESQIEHEQQTEQEQQTELPPQCKVAKLSKKKAKNWTNAARSGSDQNSDVTAWKDLFVPDQVLKALSSLGFGSPTAIQALALPPAIRDHMDIVGAAETGSGKTLSFGIPMIHHILEWKKRADESEGATDGQTEPGTQVESLYLLTVEESVDTEKSISMDTSTEVAEAAPETPAKSEACTEETREQGDPQEQGTEDVAEEDKDAAADEEDKEIIKEDEEIYHEDESDSEKIGCVKVIENMEFDFDNSAEETLKVSEKQPLLGLVLCPTRELAVQVKHHIDAVAKFTGIKTAIVVGGMAQQKQIRMLKRRPEIVIATPGRLWEMIKERHPHLVNLRQLRCLVIDEADRMVERGHFAELESLLEMLNTVQFNPKRQTFVFSATLTMAHSLPTRVLQKKGKKVDQRSKLEVLMEKVGIRSKPKVIDLTRKEATVETLTETRIHCEKEEKDFFLYYFLLQYPGRTMVFANSIDCIKRLNSLLVILDRTPLPLHANMHQKQRLKNLERFAERESCVLLTTDVAARGLDIPNVQHVIHYQVPRTSETYVHRSGRTARATKEGLSLLLVGPDDMMNFKKIYRALGKDEEVPMFPIQSKCMAAIKERVNMARKIEKIEFHNSREKQHNSWFKQAAEALEVDLDDDVLLGGRKDEDDDRQQQKMVKGMKKHLKHLISQPVFKNVMKTKYPTQMGKLSLPNMPLHGLETALTSVSNQKKRQKQKKQQQ
ncbi:ATP-dependent RNA helicase DDX24 isoform X1 [Coregonus clupeaformis]|uniref:ATP-dependent RNA helicase DDX24 isoform X1 n=1 Tax=Coregonus clupeaformis TaxID=59861 RepID=UPI001E1C6145|nr:ATP-dependent RNA helicase DDX24 isoform X1 [Coregonus clupeaformis]